MSLFIQNDDGLLGSGAVSALDAFVDIGVIGNGDPNIGATAVTGRPELEHVTYSPQVEMGTPPTRLFNLVNTNFNVNTDNIDIIIMAGGAGFTLNDGTLLRDYGGTSLPPGATFGGINFNPSDSVVVLYDTTQNDGHGFCCKPENSSSLTLQTPNPVIFYHELSHAFRQATNAVLNSVEPDCADASPEETAAIGWENEMRDQLITSSGGTPGASTRRDTNNHCGAACSGGTIINCCIIASIASGSPYSEEVNALRYVRDHFLRTSSIGLDFFDRLHADYYSFSPQVCRMMAESTELSALVGEYFVRPLVNCLVLIREYAMNPGGPRGLGDRFVRGVEESAELSSMGRVEVLGALDLVRGKRMQGSPGRQLADLIEGRARKSEYVRWALIEPLEFYVEAMLCRLDGQNAEEIGRLLSRAIDRWAARLPVTETWNDLSERGLRDELEFLKCGLLRSPDARMLFARRLPDALRKDDRRGLILRTFGFREEGEI